MAVIRKHILGFLGIYLKCSVFGNCQVWKGGTVDRISFLGELDVFKPCKSKGIGIFTIKCAVKEAGKILLINILGISVRVAVWHRIIVGDGVTLYSGDRNIMSVHHQTYRRAVISYRSDYLLLDSFDGSG